MNMTIYLLNIFPKSNIILGINDEELEIKNKNFITLY